MIYYLASITWLTINFSALFFFILFAVLFIALIALFLYSQKLKHKAKNSAEKFSHDIKTILDKMTSAQSKLIFLKQTEERVKLEKNYVKNPEGRNMLLSKIYQHKASILFKGGQKEETIVACSEILNVEPGNIQAYINRGSLYGEIGKFQEGIDDYKHAELLDSKNQSIYNNRGWIYLQMKEYESAISDFDYAISLQPTDVEYFNRGNTYKALGEWEKALNDYLESQKLHQNNDSELGKLITENIAETNSKLAKSNS